MDDLTRPIIGIENRTAQEVFDIMCDRFRHRASEAERVREACAKVAESPTSGFNKQTIAAAIRSLPIGGE